MQTGGDSSFNAFGANNPPFPSPNPNGPQPVSPTNPPLQYPQQTPVNPADVISAQFQQPITNPTGAPLQYSQSPLMSASTVLPQQPTIAPSSTDDIILAPDQPKKSNKNLIIILIVIVAITLIAAIVFAIFQSTHPGNGSNGGNGASVSTSVKEKLNTYANYMISGEASATRINGEYQEFRRYAFDNAVDNNDVDYYTRADGYWKDFLDAFHSDESLNQDSSLIIVTETQEELMEFIRWYMSISKPSFKEILNRYTNSEGRDLVGAIQATYAPLDEVKYGLAPLYLEAEMSRIKASVELLDIYNQIGCLIEDSLDISCVDNSSQDDEKYNRMIESNRNNNLQIPYRAERIIMSNCFEMSTRINEIEGGDNNRELEEEGGNG